METTKSGAIRTVDEFGDFQLHLEFATPAKVEDSGQGRGNSGIFLCGRYELQVLDSYNNPTYTDGQLGAMYGQFPPLATVPKKPGEWQSYDILFHAARLDPAGALIERARVSVLQNGIWIHDNVAVGDRNTDTLGPEAHKAGPILLQDHGNRVRFHNIWLRSLSDARS